MKNILILLLGSILIFSNCSKAKQTKQQKTSQSIPITIDTVSIAKDSTDNQIIEISPIKISSIRISENQYSDHKDIRFTYKNLGKKSIKAIKFEWYCVNSFEEPAANGRNFYAEGRFTLNVVTLIKSGHSKTEYWEDFSTDADKVVKIRAYYIVYTDGSKWRTSEEDQIQL